MDSVCESSSQILKQFKVEGLYIVCSIDIIKDSMYIQVLKVWDVLPLDEISKLAKRLDGMFAMYSDDFINCCNQKLCDGYVPFIQRINIVCFHLDLPYIFVHMLTVLIYLQWSSSNLLV